MKYPAIANTDPLYAKRNERFFENQQRHTNGLTFTDVAIALAIE